MRIKVCPRDELGEGVVKVFEEGDVEGIVVRSGDVIYACDRYCTHGVDGVGLSLCRFHERIVFRAN